MPDLDEILVSSAKEEAIKNKAPDKLPINPTAQGWSGAAVRSFLAQALVGASDSLLSELKDKMIVIKNAFEDTQNLIADGFSCAYFKNNTGGIIYRGQACYPSGRSDGIVCVDLAYASADDETKSTGVVFALDDIAAEASGFFVVSGVVDEIVIANIMEDVDELIGLTLPVPLYLSPTAGKLTAIEQSLPVPDVCVGKLIESGGVYLFQVIASNSGRSELARLRDATITSVTDGQTLIYDSPLGKWVNKNRQQVVISNTQPEAGILKEDELWFDIS